MPKTAVHHVEQSGKEYYSSGPSYERSVCAYFLGSVQEHGRSNEVEYESGGCYEVRGYADFYHSLDYGVDYDIYDFLQKISVIHNCMLFLFLFA